MEQTKTRKKLIEVALPLDKINAASSREKSIRHGHPSTLHLWWSRQARWQRRGRCCSLNWWTIPSDLPEEFPSEAEQKKERERLFRIIEDSGTVGEHDQRARPRGGPRRDPQELAPHLRRQPQPSRAQPNCSTRKDCPPSTTPSPVAAPSPSKPSASASRATPATSTPSPSSSTRP